MSRERSRFDSALSISPSPGAPCGTDDAGLDPPGVDPPAATQAILDFRVNRCPEFQKCACAKRGGRGKDTGLRPRASHSGSCSGRPILGPGDALPRRRALRSRAAAWHRPNLSLDTLLRAISLSLLCGEVARRSSPLSNPARNDQNTPNTCVCVCVCAERVARLKGPQVPADLCAAAQAPGASCEIADQHARTLLAGGIFGRFARTGRGSCPNSAGSFGGQT